MFFLLPPVTVVLLVVFGTLLGARMWRQRTAMASARPRRGPPTGPARLGDADEGQPLLPAGLLRGADRTWVVFTTPSCATDVAERLRAARPGSQVTEVDCTLEPGLAESFGVTQVPTVLVANRYGQVEARLVGPAALVDQPPPTPRP
jgi:hypothetical protein